MFTNINNIATRLENNQAVALVDIQRTMASAGDVASKLPLGDREPSVTFVFPTILTPGSQGVVSVHVIGTRIANADPRIAGQIQLRKYSDNEIGFDVDRKHMKSSADKVERTSFSLVYDVSKSVWYNPFTWWSVEGRTRDIDLTMLPEVPGSVSLKKTVRIDDWETKEDGPITVGGLGRTIRIIRAIVLHRWRSRKAGSSTRSLKKRSASMITAVMEMAEARALVMIRIVLQILMQHSIFSMVTRPTGGDITMTRIRIVAYGSP